MEWTPLGALLAGSDATIHHGGAGTTLTALDSGLPQLVLGEGADRPANAAAVRARGCGLVPPDPSALAGPDRPGRELVRRLLEDEALATAARETAEEMAAMPSPADMVHRLVELASAHGAT